MSVNFTSEVNMKSKIRSPLVLVWLLLCFTIAAQAQITPTVINGTVTVPVNLTSANAAGNFIDLRGSGISLHKITWNTYGTVSAGAGKLQQCTAADASTCTDLIGATAITSSGTSALTVGIVNFVRVQASTAVSGSGTVYVRYIGYVDRIANLSVDPSAACINTYVAYFTAAATIGCSSTFTFVVGTGVLTAPNIVTTSLTDSGLTSGRVPFASTGGLLADASTLTFASGVLTVGSGLTVTTGNITMGTSQAINSTTSRIEKIGNATIGTWNADALVLKGGSANPPSLQFGDDDTGLYSPGSNEQGITVGGALKVDFDTSAINLLSTYAMGWASGDPHSTGIDTTFKRIAAGVIGVGISTASFDNVASLGNATNRIAGVTAVNFIATGGTVTVSDGTSTSTLNKAFLSFGPLPSTIGAIRMANNTSINVRSSANSADLELASATSVDTIFLGYGASGIAQVTRIGGISTTSIVLNEDGSDTDTRIEGDTNANVFRVDAGISNGVNLGAVSINDGGTATAGYVFNVSAGTSGMQGRVYTPGLTTSAGLQTGVVCVSSAGELINDSVACLASSARFKHDITPLAPEMGLATVMALKPVNFYYNNDGWTKPDKNRDMQQIGFVAEEAEKVDARLVGYDNEGLVRTFRYENYVAVLTKAIQELNAKVAQLEAR